MRPPTVSRTSATLKSNPPFEEQDPEIPTAWDRCKTLFIIISSIIITPFCICAVVFFPFLFSYCFILPVVLSVTLCYRIVEFTVISWIKFLLVLFIHIPRYSIFAVKYAYWRVVSPLAGEHGGTEQSRLEDEYYVPPPPLTPPAITASSPSPRISQVRGDEYWWQARRIH